MESFVSGRFDRVDLIYNQFKNAAVQNLTNEIFLPVETISTDKKTTTVIDYIYETNQGRDY